MSPLSKSKLVTYRQCPKRLWLEVHRPDLREDSSTVQGHFEVGYQVGAIARKFYDESGLGHTIDVQSEGYDEAFARSAELMATSQQPVFEAGFQSEGALAFADVMLPRLENGEIVWRMVEVKSSTSVKEYHLDDLAVQAFVARSAGVKLRSVALAHLDNSWVYPGDGDYRGLLKENDLTAETFARTAETRTWIADATMIVAQPTEPMKDIGSHCSEPFPCGFHAYCSRGIVGPEHSLDYLPRLHAGEREKLAAEDIVELREVPDDLLSLLQLRVKEHTLAGTTFFDKEGAAADLAQCSLPAYFLDFESVQFAVPKWKGTRPYQQFTFQLSVQRVSQFGQLTHDSFLDLSGNDPSEPFAKALITTCGDTVRCSFTALLSSVPVLANWPTAYPIWPGSCTRSTRESSICFPSCAITTTTRASVGVGASKACFHPRCQTCHMSSWTVYRMEEPPWRRSAKRLTRRLCRNENARSKNSFAPTVASTPTPWSGYGSSSMAVTKRRCVTADESAIRYTP